MPLCPVVSPMNVPEPLISMAVSQVERWPWQIGTLMQSLSKQSVSPSWSSSRPLLQTSGTGAQLGANAQAGSAQSIRRLQSLSSPSSQTSGTQFWQAGDTKQLGSAQSTSSS